jgi:hypothetical protein
VNPFSPGLRRPSSPVPYPFGGSQPPYLRPVGGSSIADFVNNVRLGRVFRPPPRGFAASPPAAPAPNEATLSVIPPPVPTPLGQQPSSQTGEPYAGDGPWLALMGGSVIGLALARYLAYARTAAAGAA